MRLRSALASAGAAVVLAACIPTPPPPPRPPPVTWAVTLRPDCVAAGVGVWRSDPIVNPGVYTVRVGTPPTTIDGAPISLAKGSVWKVIGASVSLPFRAIFTNAAGQKVAASAVITTMPTRVCPQTVWSPAAPTSRLPAPR